MVLWNVNLLSIRVCFSTRIFLVGIMILQWKSFIFIQKLKNISLQKLLWVSIYGIIANVMDTTSFGNVCTIVFFIFFFVKKIKALRAIAKRLVLFYVTWCVKSLLFSITFGVLIWFKWNFKWTYIWLF